MVEVNEPFGEIQLSSLLGWWINQHYIKLIVCVGMLPAPGTGWGELSAPCAMAFHCIARIGRYMGITDIHQFIAVKHNKIILAHQTSFLCRKLLKLLISFKFSIVLFQEALFLYFPWLLSPFINSIPFSCLPSLHVEIFCLSFVCYFTLMYNNILKKTPTFLIWEYCVCWFDDCSGVASEKCYFLWEMKEDTGNSSNESSIRESAKGKRIF